MNCFIYKSARREYTYLYLVEKDKFEVVPEALLNVFGLPEFCFEFELTETRQLAQEDTREVIAGLTEKGFYLQMYKEDTIKI